MVADQARAMSGTLYGVGVGPGAPDLLTLRAARLIERAPVVAFPVPESAGAAVLPLARAIAAAHVRADAEEVAFRLPMHPDRAPAQGAYDAGADRIAHHLAQGRDVAVLCEGDPLFYGSFMYLMARLGPRFPVEVVPGVTSVAAATAIARLPLGARTGRIAVLPATLPDGALREGILAHEAVAVLKLGRHLPRLRALIEGLGLDATFVARATQAGEQVLPLAQAPDPAPYFSLLLIAREADPWT